MSKGFRLDLNRCTGCEACVVACANENLLPPETRWRQVVTFNDRRVAGLPAFHLSLACNHCARPACQECCPSGAYTRDPETGAVLLRAERCLGCRYCSWACPYDAPQYDPAAKVMRKCDLCVERLREGRAPACVTICPTGALELEEAGAGPSDRPAGFPDAPLQPSIAFTGARTAPRLTAAAVGKTGAQPLPPSKIGFRSEWTLVLFTTMAALMAAAVAGPLPFGWFMGLGAVALAAAASHLGRKERAWRAVWNWRTSWLSREVILFTAFLGCGTAWLATGYRPLEVAAVATGFATLFTIDRLYQAALRRPWWRFHSSQTLFTGVYLFGLATGYGYIAPLVGGFKLGLYASRKLRFRRAGKPARPWASVPRVVFGFVLPAVLPAGMLAAAVIGELIDRAEFYEELEVVTPRRQVRLDFEASA